MPFAPASARFFVPPILMLLFVLATNPWLGWRGGIERVTGDDSFIYERMANNAFVVGEEGIAMQQRPRFLGPVLAGLISRGTGLSLYCTFLGLAFLSLVLILLFFRQTLISLEARNGLLLACLGLFIWSPYAFRFYLLVPGLLPDLIFLLGLALALFGLFGGHLFPLLAGCLLATTGRQTVLVMMPGVAFGILFGRAWARWPLPRRVALAALTVAGVLVLYKTLTALSGSSTQTTGGLSSTSWLLGYAFSLIPWLGSEAFEPKQLAEHVAKTLIPLATVVATGLGFLVRNRIRPRAGADAFTCLLLIAGIALFPLLTSPLIAAGGQTRYTTYALMPSIALLAILARDRPIFPGGRLQAGFYFTALAMASLHHLNSVIGPPSAVHFTVWHLLAAAAAGIVIVWPFSEPQSAR